MYFTIGADFVPTKFNITEFTSGNMEAIICNDLLDILSNAEFRIFNLETPLTDHNTPIQKNGPNLIAPTETVIGYKAVNTDLLTLANNHIMDHGVFGFKSTVDTLKKYSIGIVGAGDDIDSASGAFYFDFCGKKVGVYACVEHEFSVAGEKTPGANPFDPLYSYDHVSSMSDNCEFIIVLYHGGKEYYRYPSPMLQRVCRRFIEKGANLVVCQHSHCIGCEEIYQKGTIVYGQGNFLFDLCNDECWQTSLLIKVDEGFSISYIPICKTGSGVKLADKERSKLIIDSFQSRSNEIKQDGFIVESFKTFSDRYMEFYLEAFNGKNSIPFRVINKLTRGKYLKNALQKKYTNINKIGLVNYIDCESHREVLLQALLDSVERQ